MDFSTFLDLTKMMIYGGYSHPKQLGHSLLGKPEGVSIKDNFYLHIATSAFIH